MDVHKSSLLAIFDAKQRLEVPLFQRQYVWNEEQHWTPLWEDIERKFTEALDGRKDAPNHFLGAMVFDQKQTPTGHVVVRQVIDGQQRLTTLQIFLSAYRDFCKHQGCDPLAAECDKFLCNTGMMADANVDKFKVWPTQLDRGQFTDVISAGSRDEVLKRHPLRRKPYARKPDPRPRMVEAYFFFFNQIESFFLGSDGEEPLLYAAARLYVNLGRCGVSGSTQQGELIRSQIDGGIVPDDIRLSAFRFDCRVSATRDCHARRGRGITSRRICACALACPIDRACGRLEGNYAHG